MKNNVSRSKNPMMDTRSRYVDITKGIAIIAVVLLHTDFHFSSSHYMPLSSLLGWMWHVAVFLLVGGFFIKESKLVHPVLFIKGKLNSLYRLLLYFYIPAVLLHNFFIEIGWYSPLIDYGGKNMVLWDLKEMLSMLLQTVCFAGREPVLGAMWFVYVLFLALAGLSVTSFILKRFTQNEKQYEWGRCIFLFVLCVFSCSLTNIMEITVPRFNNTMTAIWLVYCGYMLKNKVEVTFTNRYLMLASVGVIYHLASIYGEVHLNRNDYSDVVTLTVGSVSVLYFICYWARRIEQNVVGKFLAYCGKESFYIMALHFVGFKLVTYALNGCGVDKPLSALAAPVGESVSMMLLYVTVGVIFPICFMSLFRFCKSFIKQCRS